jgi:hypothetical protein
MTVSQSDLDSFHHFASLELTSHDTAQTWEDLLDRWRSQKEHAETIKSISRGAQDADAGRLRDLATVDEGIRSKLGFPPRAG